MLWSSSLCPECVRPQASRDASITTYNVSSLTAYQHAPTFKDHSGADVFNNTESQSNLQFIQFIQLDLEILPQDHKQAKLVSHQSKSLQQNICILIIYLTRLSSMHDRNIEFIVLSPTSQGQHMFFLKTYKLQKC